MRNKFTILFIILFFSFFSRVSLAIPLFGSNSMGRAGAGVAANNVHEIYTSNPASMMFSQYYSIGASYSSDGNTLQGSVVDTQTSTVGGGVSYFYQTNANRFEETLWKVNGLHLAIASKFTEQISVGLMGKYYWFTALNPALTDVQQFDLDAGIHFQIHPMFALGAVAHNIVIKTHRETVPLPDFVAGFSFHPIEMFTVMGDVGTWWKTSNFKSKWQIAVAAEAQFAENVVIRAGYRNILNQTVLPSQAITGGLSLIFEKFQLTYGAMFFIDTKPMVNHHSAEISLLF